MSSLYQEFASMVSIRNEPFHRLTRTESATSNQERLTMPPGEKIRRRRPPNLDLIFIELNYLAADLRVVRPIAARFLDHAVAALAIPAGRKPARRLSEARGDGFQAAEESAGKLALLRASAGR